MLVRRLLTQRVTVASSSRCSSCLHSAATIPPSFRVRYLSSSIVSPSSSSATSSANPPATTPLSSASIATPPSSTSKRALKSVESKNRKAVLQTATNIAQILDFPSPAAQTAPFPDANAPPSSPTRTVTSSDTLLTTPIFYANGVPHIGHLTTTLMMDALNRWNAFAAPAGSESNKPPSYLASGTDEHGIKVAEAAAKAGLSEKDYVTSISRTFHALFQQAHIHIDDYVRTTEARHVDMAQAVWRHLHAKGFIYLGQHEGYYSKIDECFIPDSQVEPRTTVIDGITTQTTHHDRETGNRVEYQREKNYKFRLSAFRNVLVEWINTCSPIEPESRKNEVIGPMMAQALEDISVSRLKSKVSWGIAIPPSHKSNTDAPAGDTSKPNKHELIESPSEHESHVMYVWLDALSNYLTVSGMTASQLLQTPPPIWPPTQLIGKDILRFHAIYWPAFLIALNLPSYAESIDAAGQVTLKGKPFDTLPLLLPKRLIVHGHWLVEQRKMSKSLGNVINPASLIDDFGVDPIRYYLLRDARLDIDSNFSAAEVVNHRNVLADTLGNLLSRCIGNILLPKNALPSINAELLKTHPYTDIELDLIREMNSLPSLIQPLMVSLKFGLAIEELFAYLSKINSYFTAAAPWKTAKSIKLAVAASASPAEIHLLEHSLAKTMHLCLESLRCVGLLLQPIMPSSMNKMLWRLGVSDQERTLAHVKFDRAPVAFPCDPRPSPPTDSESVFLLFQKLSDDTAATLVPKYGGTIEKQQVPTTDATSKTKGNNATKGEKKTEKREKKQRETKPKPSDVQAKATTTEN